MIEVILNDRLGKKVRAAACSGETAARCRLRRAQHAAAPAAPPPAADPGQVQRGRHDRGPEEDGGRADGCAAGGRAGWAGLWAVAAAFAGAVVAALPLLPLLPLAPLQARGQRRSASRSGTPVGGAGGAGAVPRSPGRAVVGCGPSGACGCTSCLPHTGHPPARPRLRRPQCTRTTSPWPTTVSRAGGGCSSRGEVRRTSHPPTWLAPPAGAPLPPAAPQRSTTAWAWSCTTTEGLGLELYCNRGRPGAVSSQRRGAGPAACSMPASWLQAVPSQRRLALLRNPPLAAAALLPCAPARWASYTRLIQWLLPHYNRRLMQGGERNEERGLACVARSSFRGRGGVRREDRQGQEAEQK